MNLKRNLMWNTVGNIYYLAAQWLTTILIIRLTGNYEDAGIYSVAMSLSNIFCIVASYNVRNFQTSDLKNEYSNSDYIAHRFTTIAIALVACIIFSVITYRSIYTISIIFFYTLFRIGDSFVDALHGINQKHDRMDIIGKSCIIRGTYLLIAFCVCELATKNLLITVLAMTVGAFLFIVIYDVKKTASIDNIKVNFQWEKIKKLYVACFPMLIYGVALNITASLPRVTAEKMVGAELLGYYSSVATPAVVVQSLLNVIFAPFIVSFTRYYEEKKKKEFYGLAWKLIVFCICVGIFAVIGSILLGKWVLVDILYQDQALIPYCYLLNTTMVCTSMMALIWLLAILLTITRSIYSLSFATIIGTAVEFVLSHVLISNMGLDGINYSLIISYLITIIFMGIFLVRKLKKHFSE